MSTTYKNIACALACAVSMFIAQTTQAVVQCAFDDGSDVTYADGWQTGDNGGTGFGSWTLQGFQNGPFDHGHFMGDSTANDGGDSNFDGDVGNPAWGLYANNQNTGNNDALSEAIRSINQPLQVGDTFSIEIDNGYLDQNQLEGFTLRDSSGNNRFEFFFRGGNGINSYKVVDAGGESEISPNLGFTGEGVLVEFTLTGTETYSVTVTRLQDAASSTQAGTLSNAGLPISAVRLFNYNPGPPQGGVNSGGGSAYDLYANTMAVEAPDLALSCPADQTVAVANPGSDPVTFTEPTLGSASGGCQPLASVGSSPQSGDVLAAGNNVITSTVTDNAGNTAQCTFNVFVAQATCDISVTCPADVTVNAETDLIIPCEAPAPDFTGTASVTLTPGGCTTYTVTQSPTAGTPLGEGLTTITVTATDDSDAGNFDTCTVNVTVKDATAPVVNAPADITVSCDAVPSTPATVTADDNCDGALTANFSGEVDATT